METDRTRRLHRRPTTTHVIGRWPVVRCNILGPEDGFPGGAQNVRLLVAETGEFQMTLYPDVDHYFAADSEQVFGDFDIDAGDISTVGNAIWVGPVNATGDDWAAFGLAGNFEAGESISGTFQANFGAGRITKSASALFP